MKLTFGTKTKRFFCFILSSLMLLSLCCTVFFAAGCSRETASGDEQAFTLFMNSIRNGQFTEAFSFISAHVAPENAVDDSIEAYKNTITLAQFEKRYESLFSLLGVNDIEYNIAEENISGNSKKVIKYTMTYKTQSAGDLTNEYEMTLLKENNLWRIVWQPSHIFPDMAWGDTFDRATLAAERGDIVSHGAVVATNVRLVTVYALLSEIAPKNVLTDEIMQENAGMSELDAEKEADRLYSDAEYLNTRFSAEFDAAAAEIAAVLDLDAAELRTKFGKNANEFITVYQAMPDEVTVEQQEQLNAVNGVHVDTEHYGSKRYYPYGSLLAHTLGYISFATWEEIQTYNEGRDPNDGLYTTDSKVGKSGIEKLYERELRGKDGYYFFIRGTDGAVKKVIYRKDKVDGSDVMLTIDFKLQQRTEELLDLVLFGTDTAGAVVVMNPKTGEVNAIASNPSYDLNRFIKGMSGDEYKTLEEQENEPLRNRAARELYPPGSTFKAFTAAAALDTGTVNENYVFTGYIDNDYWKPTGYGEWPWPRIKRTRVYHRTEPMNMTNCMLHSDNIYFADVALKIGQEKFIAYFNEKLGMDKSLPYELGAARSQLYSRGSVMDNKMLADSGYGQGQVLVTPLQLAAMFSAFANNGDMPTPRITDGLYVTDGVEYKCIRKSEYSVWMEDAISTNAINKIVPMLQGVVDPNKNGTGRSLRVTNVDVAAKTGSAEIGKDKTRMYSWFAGFRLNVAQEDERVVIVMLDVPDSGAYSSLKFQIARELLKLDDTPRSECSAGGIKQALDEMPAVSTGCLRVWRMRLFCG